MVKEWWQKINEAKKKKLAMQQPKKKTPYQVAMENNKLGEYFNESNGTVRDNPHDNTVDEDTHDND